MRNLFDNPRRTERSLKIITIGMGIFGILLYACVLPEVIDALISYAPEFSGWARPWLILIWLTAVPCYIALALVWRMASDAGRNRPFTMRNAGRLQRIAGLAAGDGIFFLLMNVIYWLAGINHPGILALSCMIFFACIAFAVVTRALAVMVARAAELQEESDLTI